MPKRGKFEINKSDELQEVDLELERAMDDLDSTNERIDAVLSGLDQDVKAPLDGDPAVERQEAETRGDS